ncbi:SPOR domain-containing protein, partial [Teichococcus aerophilus]
PMTAPQLAAPQAPAMPAPVAPTTPAPVAPAVAPPQRVAAGGAVVVQLGALDSEAGARTEWDRLARRAPELLHGRSPQIIRFERQDKPTMWRLRTGGFSAEAAREFCDGIRGKGGACAVIGG